MPASWELAQIKENRLLVAILAPPDLSVSLDFSSILQKLKLPPGSTFAKLVGRPPGPARNEAAKMALSNGYHLAMFNPRIRVPDDGFLTLLATGLDLVSGLCYDHYYPHVPLVLNAQREGDGTLKKVVATDWKPGDIVPCTFIHGGFTIYRRRVLEALFARYPRPFEWGLDVAPVPSEGMAVPPLTDTETFSWRAVQLGFQPYVHTGVVGLLEVRAVVGPRWSIPYPSAEAHHGVVGVLPS